MCVCVCVFRRENVNEGLVNLFPLSRSFSTGTVGRRPTTISTHTHTHTHTQRRRRRRRRRRKRGGCNVCCKFRGFTRCERGRRRRRCGPLAAVFLLKKRGRGRPFIEFRRTTHLHTAQRRPGRLICIPATRRQRKSGNVAFFCLKRKKP